MNTKLSTLLLTMPLLFSACNNNQVSVPTTEQTATTTSVSKTVQESVTSSNGNKALFVDKPAIEKRGLLHIKSFMETLQPTLKSALESDNTHVTAMGVCTAIAKRMTDSYNQGQTEVKIRRTALKYRSELNKPDTTDSIVMQLLADKKDFKPVVVEQADHYRVYKPLPTKKACLICHGDSTNISPIISTIIKNKYPNDLATGFRLGEFRGAVVAEIQK